MVMETLYLEPDNEMIKKVKHDFRKNRRTLRSLYREKNIFYVIAIAFILGFAYYCVKYNNAQTGVTEFTPVMKVMAVVSVLMFVLMIITHFLIKDYEGSLISEQDSEWIEIDGNRLYYTFKAKNAIDFTLRQVIIIDLTRLNKVEYDEKLHVVTIDGMMLQKEIKITCDIHSIGDEEMEESDLNIFDYFNPSLYESIKGYVKK
jgi:hypothetical protein